MAQIPADKVQEVRDRTDIIDLIGRYVELRRSGQNYKGLCPFHEERTPSFNVNPARRGFKCFGCGQGGDAIRFVMELEGKSFPEAIRKLAELYGVDLPQASAGDARRDQERRNERDEMYRIMTTATEVYRRILVDAPEGEACRAYVKRRGLGDEIAQRFSLGYAPAPSEAGWDTLAREIAKNEQSLELAEKLGLVAHKSRGHYDKFLGRLMFPVIQPGGEVVAFSGRIVPPHDEEADGRTPHKYVNSPEVPGFFTKGKTLFGLHAARQAIREQGRALLVEGNIDVVSLHQRGHGATVAPLGTALTEKQAHLLSRFCDAVVLCFDGDDAGRKAAVASLPLLLAEGMDVRTIRLEDGEDPDSVDPQRFSALLERAQPAVEDRIVRLANWAGRAIDARSRALDEVLPLIRAVPRASARYLYAERAAELLGFPVQKVREHVERRAPADKKSRQIPSTSGGLVSVSAPVRPVPPLPDGQADLATLLVDVPSMASRAERVGVLECVTDSRLGPIVRSVIEGAKDGHNPTMPELLELVDASAQEQVHESVFSGKYRDFGGDPAVELQALVQRCREAQLEAKIRDIDVQTKQAHASGDPETVRQLQQERLELRRQQTELRAGQRLGQPPISPSN